MTYMHQDVVVDKYDNIRPQSFPNTLLFSLSVLCYLSRNIEEKEKHDFLKLNIKHDEELPY